MIYILLALLFYTIAIILSTYASRSADSSIVTVIVNAVSVIIPLMVVAVTFWGKSVAQPKLGVIYAILGGVSIALFTLALNRSFVDNNVAVVVPIVYGGMIFLTAVLSTLLFGEKITLVQGIGLVLICAGLGFVIYARMKGV